MGKLIEIDFGKSRKDIRKILYEQYLKLYESGKEAMVHEFIEMLLNGRDKIIEYEKLIKKYQQDLTGAVGELEDSCKIIKEQYNYIKEQDDTIKVQADTIKVQADTITEQTALLKDLGGL